VPNTAALEGANAGFATGCANAEEAPAPAQIARYGTRFWAVYLNGELLAVTVYKKGAVAVQELLNSASS